MAALKLHSIVSNSLNRFDSASSIHLRVAAAIILLILIIALVVSRSSIGRMSWRFCWNFRNGLARLYQLVKSNY